MKDGCDFVSLNKALVPFCLFTFLNWFGVVTISQTLIFPSPPSFSHCQLPSFFSGCVLVALPLSDSTLLLFYFPHAQRPSKHDLALTLKMSE